MSGDDADQVERALVAEREVADAKRAGRKLGVQLLDDFAQLFGSLAAFYQPHPAGMAPNPNADPVQFEKWSRLAVETAARLAPYQSPTYRAIVTAPAPEAGVVRRRFTLSIFEKELVPREPPQAELELARDPRTGRFAAKTEPDQAVSAEPTEPYAEPLAGVVSFRRRGG
jgi:hypothetical protein